MPFNASPPNNSKPCFGALFSINAKECQNCATFSHCKEKTPPRKSAVIQPVGLAILQYLSKHDSVSVPVLDKHLRLLFKGRRINTYNWIGVLKEEGYLTMKNKGRCRVYALR